MAKPTLREMYLSGYGFIKDNYHASDIGRDYVGPFAFLRTANGSCLAIQAVTLPRRHAKGSSLAGHNPALIKLIATNPWAARAVPKARKHHKARMRGLSGVDDASIIEIASEIIRVRGARQYTDYRSPKFWEGGSSSKATLTLDKMQRAIQRQWQSGEKLSLTPEIRQGIGIYTQARLSRQVGGGLK